MKFLIEQNPFNNPKEVLKDIELGVYDKFNKYLSEYSSYEEIVYKDNDIKVSLPYSFWAIYKDVLSVKKFYVLPDDLKEDGKKRFLDWYNPKDIEKNHKSHFFGTDIWSVGSLNLSQYLKSIIIFIKFIFGKEKFFLMEFKETKRENGLYFFEIRKVSEPLLPMLKRELKQLNKEKIKKIEQNLKNKFNIVFEENVDLF